MESNHLLWQLVEVM